MRTSLIGALWLKPCFRFDLAVLLSTSVLLFLISGCSPNRVETGRRVEVTHSSLLEYLQGKRDISEIENVPFGGMQRQQQLYMKALEQQAPGKLVWPVKVPLQDPALRFAVQYRVNHLTTPGEAHAQIVVSGDGFRDVVYSRNYWISNRFQLREFQNERISLAKYAGQEVRISFENSTDDLEVSGFSFFWGNPTVFARRRTSRPNIVLICIDTLRRDRVGTYNPSSELTPSLKKLAKDGVVFEHAISNSPWTLPSVSSVLTGLTPSFHLAGMKAALPDEMSEEEQKRLILGTNTGTRGLSPEVLTAPEILANRYVTHMVNSNAFLRFGNGPAQRFHSLMETSEHRSTAVTGEAKRWISDHADQLFFLYTHYIEPHDYRYRFREISGLDREQETDKGRLMEIYDKLITIADADVGGLIQHLQDLDLYDKSLIIFYADHGEHFWEEPWGKLGHGNSLSDLLLEVPLIVKFPGSRHAGERVETPVQLLDIFHTITEEARMRVDGPAYLAGASLAYALDSNKPSDRVFFSEFLRSREKKAVQSNGYRLIFDPKSEQYELLDLTTDQLIATDLSDEERSEVERLKGHMRDYLTIVSKLDVASPHLDLNEADMNALGELGYLE